MLYLQRKPVLGITTAILAGIVMVILLFQSLPSSVIAKESINAEENTNYLGIEMNTTHPLTFTPVATAYLPLVMTSLPCPGSLRIDDFSNPNSGWPVGHQSDGSILEYIGGEYHISPRNYSGHRYFNGWSASEFWLSVKGRGTDGGYGIVFGQNPNNSLFEFYMFYINTTEKTYKLTRWAPNPNDVKVWSGNSNAIHPGAEVNELRVERKGEWIRLFVNNTQIEQIQDSMFIGERLVGLGTMNIDEVYYDDFKVCTYDH